MSHAFRWDLDKTYLQTDFDSVRGLVKAALQSAEEKQNIPGTAELMRELQAAGTGKNRILVVSGSPSQMRRVLERKLQLDGVAVDSLVLKPTLGHVLRLRFRAVRDQLGYKLPSLLESRRTLPDELAETCFGDDAEMDGLVYRLYGDVCAGRVAGAELESILSAGRLYPEQAERIRLAAANPIGRDPVQRVLIHLETGSPTARFAALGPRVAPTFNTFQASLVLHVDGHLTTPAVARVVDAMIREFGYTSERLQRSLEDVVRRRLVKPQRVEAAVTELGLQLPPAPRNTRPTVESDADATGSDEPPVDYVALLHELHDYHQKRKQARKRRRGIRGILGLSKDD